MVEFQIRIVSGLTRPVSDTRLLPAYRGGPDLSEIFFRKMRFFVFFRPQGFVSELNTVLIYVR